MYTNSSNELLGSGIDIAALGADDTNPSWPQFADVSQDDVGGLEKYREHEDPYQLQYGGSSRPPTGSAIRYNKLNINNPSFQTPYAGLVSNIGVGQHQLQTPLIDLEGLPPQQTRLFPDEFSNQIWAPPQNWGPLQQEAFAIATGQIPPPAGFHLTETYKTKINDSRLREPSAKLPDDQISNCQDYVQHVDNCQLCKSYYSNKTKWYLIAIAMLVVIILFMVIMRVRKR